MKKNIKNLVLILFSLNNNFNICYSDKKNIVKKNQDSSQKQQQSNIEKYKIVYLAGGVGVVVLIIIKLLNQKAPIVQIQENNPIQENNLIQEIHDEIQLFDMENINPILMDKTNFFKPKDIFMENTIENLLKQHPNDFFFYVFQNMIDMIYEHKDEIKNIKDLSSDTFRNISKKINILNIALKSSFTMNDIEKLEYRKDYEDQKKIFINDINMNCIVIISSFYRLCVNEKLIKNEEFQNKILYFFRKNKEKILFFYDINTVDLTQKLLLSLSTTHLVKSPDIKKISFYTMLNIYLLLFNNENFLNKINKNPEDKQFISKLINSKESDRVKLMMKQYKPSFNKQGEIIYPFNIKDFDKELQQVKDKLS